MTTKHSPTPFYHRAELRSDLDLMTEDCRLKHTMFYRALFSVLLRCANNTDIDEIGTMCMKIKQECCLVKPDGQENTLPTKITNFFCYVLVFDSMKWNIIALVLMPRKV